MKIDKRISKIIPKNSNDDFVYNEKFVKYRDELLKKFSSDGDFYFVDDDKFFDIAREHLNKYSNVFDSYEGVVLVHPFYASTKDLDKMIKDPYKMEAYQKYMFNLNHFFSKNNKKVVLFDNLYSYLAFSSRLLEEKMVNGVVITNRNSGFPYLKGSLDEISFNDVFVGGMYGGGCLDTAIESLREKNVDIYGIKDLSLRLPFYNNILDGVRVSLPKDKIIFLKDILD